MLNYLRVAGTSSSRCSISAYMINTTMDIVFLYRSCCSFGEMLTKIFTGQAVWGGLLCTLFTSWPRACVPFKVARWKPWG